MTDKEKIISEIQRRINLFRKDGKLGSDTEIALYGLINFINAMHEEPVSEDLEEASKGWLIPQLDKSYASYGENMMMELTHFDGYAMLDAIEFGAQWHKQQMIKSAKLSGWVARDEDGSLHLFKVEPRRIEDRHQWWDRDYNCTALKKSEFPDLKWEDEPVYVKLPIIVED